MKKSSIGRIMSKETKELISNSCLGDKNPMYGKKHSEETKEKMRKPHKYNSKNRAGIKRGPYKKSYSII